MDRISCNRCGLDLTSAEGGRRRRQRRRVPCPNCGSLTREFAVVLEPASMVLAASPVSPVVIRQDAVARPETIAVKVEVPTPTVIVTQESQQTPTAGIVDIHFEHVLKCWHEGDTWTLSATSPNGMPFMAMGDDVHEMYRAAAEAIADEID